MKSCNLKRTALWLDVVTDDSTGKVVPVAVENICFYVGETTVTLDGWKKNGQTLDEYLTEHHLASLYGAA